MSLLATSGGCGPEAGAPVDRILLVTIDTLRSDRLGYMGYDVETPNLDRLAREGAVFTEAISAAPITLPAHSSILTGLRPPSHGVRQNGIFRLADEVETVAETLQRHGFQTAAFVGAFVLDRRFGLEQGFDLYDDDLPEENPISKSYFAERRAEEVVARALDWIRDHEEERFFVWVHLFDPHAPYNPPAPYDARYRGRPYDGEIAYTDSALGPLLDAVRGLGDRRKTAIVVTADHGESMGRHGESTHALFVYDSTVKVPLILKAPGIPEGARIDSQVRSIDITPTLLDLAGISPESALDGRSLLGAFGGEGPPDAPAYGETFAPRYEFNWSELRFLRTKTFKVIDAPKPEIYDLKTDPEELTNLWGDEAPEAGRRLLEELRALPEGTAGPSETLASDETVRRRLESLGYLGAAPSTTARRARPDPKDRVEVFEQMQVLLDPELSPEERMEGYRQILALEPDNVLARSRLANGLAEAGHLEEAVEAFRELLRVSEIDANGWENLASALLLLDRVDEALEVTKRAVEEVPWSRELQVLRGEALEKAGRYRDALASYEKAIALRPEVAENHFRHGAVALELGDDAGAERDFREALARDAAFAPARAALVRLLSRRGRAEEAIALIRTSEGETSSTQLRTALAEAYLAEERFDEARSLLEEVLAATPDDARALALLGALHGRLGELGRARDLLERALAAGETGPDLRRNLALVYLRRGDFKRAIRELRLAVERAPDDASLWFTLGNAYLRAKRPREAAEAFETAVERRPAFPEATFNLGLAYERAAEPEKAAKAFRTFLEGEGARNTEKRAEAEKRLRYLQRGRRP